MKIKLLVYNYFVFRAEREMVYFKRCASNRSDKKIGLHVSSWFSESATRVGYGSDLFKLAGRAHVRSPTVYVAKPSSGSNPQIIIYIKLH